MLQQENEYLRRKLMDANYMIVGMMPRQSGLLYNLKQGYKTFKKCDKRVLAARIIGTLVSMILIVALCIAFEHFEIDSDSASAWSLILAVLLGWKVHQVIKFRLLKKPSPRDEDIIFMGWLMSSFVIIFMGVINHEMAAPYHPLWRQLLVVVLVLPITLLALLLIVVRQKRQLEALKSSNLLTAVLDTNFAGVRQALASGAEVNIRNRLDQTPLELAFMYPPCPDMAKMLIEAGADPNARDEHNYTPLHRAVMIGNLELVQMLLQRGADINAVGRWGCTPLHLAVHGKECKAAIVRELLAKGADVNACASWGHTPLHYAYADLQMDIAGLLIDAGADADIEATWLTHHRYYDGHYDTVRIMIDLEDAHEQQRRHDITPADVYDAVVEDELNPRNSIT